MNTPSKTQKRNVYKVGIYTRQEFYNLLALALLAFIAVVGLGIYGKSLDNARTQYTLEKVANAIGVFGGFMFASVVVNATNHSNIYISLVLFFTMLFLYVNLLASLPDILDHWVDFGDFEYFTGSWFGGDSENNGPCSQYSLAKVKLDRDVLAMKRAKARGDKKQIRSLKRKVSIKYHPDTCVKVGCQAECTEAMQYINSLL